MRTISAAILILIVGLAAYSNSFTGIFVFDDEPAIAQNGNLHRLSPLTTAMSAPPHTTLAGRPVASLSFAIDYARSGGSLFAYHATNLVIHLAATLFLFGITRRTLRTPVLRDAHSLEQRVDERRGCGAGQEHQDAEHDEHHNDRQQPKLLSHAEKSPELLHKNEHARAHPSDR